MRSKSAILISIIFALCAPLFAGCMQSVTDSGAYKRAFAALSEGDFETAMDEFRTAENKDGRTTESSRGMGIACYRNGDYETALSFFEISLASVKYENEEFTEDVKYYEADCYAKIGEYEKAEETYLQLTEGRTPGVAWALLGALYIAEEDEPAAGNAFENAVSGEGESGYKPYIIIYEALKDEHREADGVAYLEGALDLVPETAEDYEMQGRIYYYLENYDKARTALNTAIDMESIDALTLMGSICLEMGDTPQAREMYLNALNAGVDEALCFGGLAMCSATSGNFEDALGYISQGLDADDTGMTRSLLYDRMIIYEMMHDFASAKAQAEELLSLYPNDEAVKREYKFLAHA